MSTEEANPTTPATTCAPGALSTSKPESSAGVPSFSLIERISDSLERSHEAFKAGNYGKAAGIVEGFLRGLRLNLDDNRYSITTYLVDIIADDFDDLCRLMTDEDPLTAVAKHLLGFARHGDCKAYINLFGEILESWVKTLDLPYLLEALKERHKKDLLQEFESNLEICDFAGFATIGFDDDGTIYTKVNDQTGREVWVALAPNGKASACFGHDELKDISISEAFCRVDAYIDELA